jgi:ribosome biogenesis GTPase
VTLAGGGMIIDTAGLRELQPLAGDDGVDATFPEIEDAARQCRFRDCRHEQEPGCAVRAALAAGELDADRYESYLRLLREQAFLATKIDERAARAEHQRHKQFGKMVKEMKKKKTKW